MNWVYPALALSISVASATLTNHDSLKAMFWAAPELSKLSEENGIDGIMGRGLIGKQEQSSAPQTVPSTNCPNAEPNFQEECIAEGLACRFGEECCCGECHPSLRFECIGGTWAMKYTDACLMPPCGSQQSQAMQSSFAGTSFAIFPSSNTSGEVDLLTIILLIFAGMACIAALGFVLRVYSQGSAGFSAEPAVDTIPIPVSSAGIAADVAIDPTGAVTDTTGVVTDAAIIEIGSL